jgi:FtsP/CotA-like multicopper oxidase with cupredoxin domain
MTGVSNSEHGSRVTNLHAHGLHAVPGANAGRGTESDNVLVRLLSRDDWAMRQKMAGGATCEQKPHEYVGHVDYEFFLGHAQRAAMQRSGRPPQPDPPGTHWYHPHAHGSTHDQVSAGMAGFLIVEGDVDDAINRAMTGETRPDPTTPTGPHDYRERLVFIQRVIIPSVDFNAPGSRRQRLFPVPVPAEGVPPPTVMFMRPGAVERWRVLNASVDGRGFKRFMVLDGQYVFKGDRLHRVEKADRAAARRLVPMTRAAIEAAKLPLYQLAFDGVTLVTVENGRARHTIKDLSAKNAGSVNPLTRPSAAGESDMEAALRNVEACFRDGESLRNAFVRPNEVWMATANRTDVFFKAPLNAAGRIFTVLAQEEILHTDNFQGRLQRGVALARGAFGPGNPGPVDVVVAHVHVRGTAVEGGDFDVMSLRDRLPPVPPYLQPITDDETRVTASEARARGVPVGSHRTRVVSYTGYGSAGFPVIEVPEAYAKAHPELRNLTWAEYGGTRVLLPPNARTMAINNQMDLAHTPQPPAPRKFSPGHPDRTRVLVDTAEEWVLYNPSLTLWAHTDLEKFPQRGAMLTQYRSYPVSRVDGQRRFWRDHEFRMVVNAADHPFHMHVNPLWVTRIEVPDERGELHNLLEEPRWMDTVSIPRNGGRVVFRTRFADYTGRWIHHCHILMHEDMGMMQEIECVASAASCNANPRDRVASHGMTDAEVSALYPRPSVEMAYRQGLSFVDPNPSTGQVFPGFELEVPKLAD